MRYTAGMELKVSCSALSRDAKEIREEVFVREQGFCREFDETDAQAAHLVLYADGEPAAVCRVYFSEGWHIGRLAVRKKFRGGGLGRELLRAAEAEIKRRGGKACSLCAQTRARGFYESCGYRFSCEVEADEGVPHVRMEKRLG